MYSSPQVDLNSTANSAPTSANTLSSASASTTNAISAKPVLSRSWPNNGYLSNTSKLQPESTLPQLWYDRSGAGNPRNQYHSNTLVPWNLFIVLALLMHSLLFGLLPRLKIRML